MTVDVRFIDIGETEAFLRRADAIKTRFPEAADDVAALIALAMPVAADVVTGQPHDTYEPVEGVTQCRRCGELGHRAADPVQNCTQSNAASMRPTDAKR